MRLRIVTNVGRDHFIFVVRVETQGQPPTSFVALFNRFYESSRTSYDKWQANRARRFIKLYSLCHGMMESDLNQLAERFTDGYGVADCVFESVAERLQGSIGDRDALLKLTESTPEARVALEHLSLLSWPASRHVAFRAACGRTVFVNNSRNGSDYADQKIWLAKHLKTRFARIVDKKARTWTNGSQRETIRYAATIFELFDPNGNLIRAVYCMNDGGRWVFGESGDCHPIERSFPYDAQRKRDRFGTAQLSELATAFNIPTIQARDFLNAGRYYLFNTPAPPINVCTVAEADDPAYAYYRRGLNWVPWIETHASSVVADFERCIKLNPEYEPKVRTTLDHAYRILATERNA